MSANISRFTVDSEPSEPINLKNILAVKPFSMDEFMLPDIDPIPEGAVPAKFGRKENADDYIPPPIRATSS